MRESQKDPEGDLCVDVEKLLRLKTAVDMLEAIDELSMALEEATKTKRANQKHMQLVLRAAKRQVISCAREVFSKRGTSNTVTRDSLVLKFL